MRGSRLPRAPAAPPLGQQGEGSLLSSGAGDGSRGKRSSQLWPWMSAMGTYILLARAHVHIRAYRPHVHMHGCHRYVHAVLVCTHIGVMCILLSCTYTCKGVTGRCVLCLHACAGVPMGTRILLSHARSSADTLACARLMPLRALVHTPRLTPSLAYGLSCACVHVHAVL